MVPTRVGVNRRRRASRSPSPDVATARTPVFPEGNTGNLERAAHAFLADQTHRASLRSAVSNTLGMRVLHHLAGDPRWSAGARARYVIDQARAGIRCRLQSSTTACSRVQSNAQRE